MFKVSFDQLHPSRVGNSNPSATVGGFSRTQRKKSRQWFLEFVWDPIMWSVGMVQLPLSSLSGEMSGDKGLMPCKSMLCDLAVEEICFPVEVLRLISMEYEQLCDIILLPFDMRARNGESKQLCSGSYGSTHWVILRDSPSILAVAIVRLPSKVVAVDIKPRLKEWLYVPRLYVVIVRALFWFYSICMGALVSGTSVQQQAGAGAIHPKVHFETPSCEIFLCSCSAKSGSTISNDWGAVAIRGASALPCLLSLSQLQLCPLYLPHEQCWWIKAHVPATSAPLRRSGSQQTPSPRQRFQPARWTMHGAGRGRGTHLLPPSAQKPQRRKVPQAKLLIDVPQHGHLLARQSHQSIAQWPERYLVGKCLVLFSSGSHLICPQRRSVAKALGPSHGWQWIHWGL